MNDRKVIRFIIFILLPLTIGYFSYKGLRVYFVESANTQDVTKISVEIKKNETFKDICQNIANKGLIKHWKVLDIIARIRGRNLKLKVGEYVFHKAMSPVEIYEILKAGLDYKREVKINDGMNVFDISKAINKAGIFEYNEFLQVTKSRQTLIQAGIRAKSMEGYLNSGTYKFSKLGKPENLIWKMYAQSEKKWTRSLSELAAVRNLSRHDVLTKASLIEREVKDKSQYYDFSAYIQNRMKAFMKLELESSLRYATKNFKNPLTEKQLNLDNPYNLFKNTGLPPSPICTPSQKAITAALNPSLNNYTEFIKLPNGKMVFSEKTNEALNE